jgi:site-specific DNA-methyltransferase (adenine-specific)
MRIVDLFQGDCLDVIDTLRENSVDAVVTDPPYHFTSIIKRFGGENAAPAKFGTDGLFQRSSRGFMGKEWDGGDIAFRSETWARVMRAMKPGAHLVAFGAPKNYHRLAVAIEDAGFEIRDCLQWVFGSGFPKSHNLDGEWSGWGTALKPAYEPIVLARKPLSEKTVAANVLKWGTGAINVDATRILSDDVIKPVTGKGTLCGTRDGYDRPWKHDPEALAARQERANVAIEKANMLGRWPANLCHDGSDEVLAGFPESKTNAGQYKKDAGIGSVTIAPQRKSGTVTSTGDSGSAARFFYCAKASKADRAGSKHPTVKPVALMRWLVRMVTPLGGTVLDPFAGSGTTGQAAVEENVDAVLIERESEYVEDIRNRLAFYLRETARVA